MEGRLAIGNNGSRPSLIVDRSTTRRVAPTRSFVLAIFNNARDGRVATRESKHLSASRAIGLRIVVSKRDSCRVVVIARLLAIRTPRFGIDN
jgi:hypothetical protein